MDTSLDLEVFGPSMGLGSVKLVLEGKLSALSIGRGRGVEGIPSGVELGHFADRVKKN